VCEGGVIEKGRAGCGRCVRKHSGNLLPPSPPAEKADALALAARNSSTACLASFSRSCACFRAFSGGAAHSMKASAQVTAPGAVTSIVVAVSTRPNRQNKSTCSRMSVSLVQIQIAMRILRPNRGRCVNCLALPIIIILMETIKHLYKRH
jgi:hypothetical protein